MSKLEYGVGLVGECGVGKTTMLNTLLYGPGKRDASAHVLMCDWPRKEIEVGEQKVQLQLRDTAGQERFGALNKFYYRGCSALIFVYDCTSTNTKDSISDWLRRAEEGCELTSTKRFLVGNKIDLKEGREVSSEEGRQFATENDMVFFETSAIDGTGVQELFRAVASAVHEDPNLPEGAVKVLPVNPAPNTAGTESWCNC